MCVCIRALCRIKLLPVTHVLVDSWILTVKPVYKLSKCAWWPEMGYKHTYDTIYTHFQGITDNIYGFGSPFLLLHFFYPSTHISARPCSVLPVLIWRVDRSLHKAMVCIATCWNVSASLYAVACVRLCREGYCVVSRTLRQRLRAWMGSGLAVGR